MKNLMVLFIVFSFVSCQDDGSPDSSSQAGLSKNNILVSNNIDREYHLFVPENHVDKPLVILLHGNGSSHDDIIGENNISSPHKIWLSIAEQDEFLVLIPNGTLGESKRGWNDCRTDADSNPTSNDVAFIFDLITKLKVEYDFDEDRVYVAGTSNGGHMAFRLAQEIPEKITAFASIAASIPQNSSCENSSTPISALYMNGTEDPFLPFEGGSMASNRGEVMSTQESIEYWVTRNGTTTLPVNENITDSDTGDDCFVIKSLYTNGTNNTEVALYTIDGGGHTEPSIQERYRNIVLLLLGNQNGDVEMAEEVWNFFKDKSK